MEKTKFLVVGMGHIGKRHAAMIMANQEAELIGMVDILPKDSLELDSTFDEIPFFPSIEAVQSSGLDFSTACICTPNYLHASQAIKLLEAKKHVVIEKPMALNKEDCEKIIHKALNVGRQVFCVMQNRYSPPSRWLKELMEQQLLGEVYMLDLRCFWNRDDRYYHPNGKAHAWHGIKEKDGGTLFTQFSHFVDMTYWLLGDWYNIQAKSANFNHQHSTDFEDSGWVTFNLSNGALGNFLYSTAIWDQNFESSMTIIGSKGTVKVGGQYMDRIDYCHVKDYHHPELPPSSPPNDYGGYTGSAANHHYVIQNVLDVINGRKEITTNALEGMKTVEIIEKIYYSG